jgi:hypothetical protein
MEIPKELVNDIISYCNANNITDIDGYLKRIINVAQTIEKYGATPITKIIEKEVLKLPIIINSNKLDKFSYEILQLLQDKLSEDVFITRRFFPYRKNKPILNLPKFPFSLNDNVDKTLERLTRYSSKIEQM